MAIKPERRCAAPVYAFARRWGTALGDGLGSAPLPGAGRALGLRLKSNISVSTHAPAWARRIHTCLIYLRKSLLNVIPRSDAESSVVKFRNVSASEAAGPRVGARGDEMAVSCIRLSKNINRLGSAGLPAMRRTGAAVRLGLFRETGAGISRSALFLRAAGAAPGKGLVISLRALP